MNASRFPPGPKFAIGAYLAFYRDPLRHLFRMQRRYGDLIHLHLAGDHHYIVAHPDYVKAVLLADENEMLRSIHRPLRQLFGKGLLGSQGEFHAAQRRLIQPSFNKPQVAEYATVVAEYAERLRERWRHGQTFDVTEEMMSLTMAIIVKVLFGADIENEARDVASNLETIVAMTHRRRVPFHSKQKLERAQAQLDAFVFGLIEQRRREGGEHPDFLSALLQMAQPEEWTPQQRDQQVRDEAMTMFVAGHETMASSMAWTWYLLAQNPEAEARLHGELDAVLGGRTPGVDDLHRLTYTGMVVAESMRLYPPVWAMTRRTIHDFSLGDYVVPAGAYIHVSQYLVHRDARYFPDPERFDPLRWTPEDAAARPRFSYFPFGAGSRKCVGENLAMVEALLLLAALAQRWSLRLVGGAGNKPQPLVSLRPAYGTIMKLEERLRAGVSQAHDCAHA
jgi:cytochrome P450